MRETPELSSFPLAPEFSPIPGTKTKSEKKLNNFLSEKQTLKDYKTNKITKSHVQNVPIFSANCAGCGKKVQSLVDNVNHLGAGIIILQETHLKERLN